MTWDTLGQVRHSGKAIVFLLPFLQVAVFARPSAMRCVKGVLLLSQAVSGLVATFVVAFPIHVISSRGGMQCV